MLGPGGGSGAATTGARLAVRGLPGRGPLALVCLLVILGLALGVGLLTADWRILGVGLAALLLVMLCLRVPFLAVIVYLLIATLRPEELGLSPVTFRLQLVFALVCLMAVELPRLMRNDTSRWGWAGTDRSLAFLMAATWLSIPLSVSRTESAFACYELAKTLFAYYLVRRTASTPERIRVVGWAVIASTTITAALALHGGNTSIGEHNIARAQGLTSVAGDPDTLANGLVAGLPFIVVFAVHQQGWTARLLLSAAGLLCLYETAQSGTRSAAVSLLAVVILLVLTSNRRVISLLALGIAMLFCWTTLPQAMKDRYATLQDYQHEGTYQTRRANVDLSLRMLAQHPLTGVGYEQFMIARAEEYDHVWLQPHNVYAQVAAEMGLIGIVAFAAFIISLARTARAALTALTQGRLITRHRQWLRCTCSAVLVTLVALLVQGLASHNLGRWNYYLAAALATNCLVAAGPAGEKRPADEAALGGRLDV